MDGYVLLSFSYIIGRETGTIWEKYIIKIYVQGVHELRQRTFEPLLIKLAHEIWIAI